MLAALAQGRLREKRELLKSALRGCLTPHHRFNERNCEVIKQRAMRQLAQLGFQAPLISSPEPVT